MPKMTDRAKRVRAKPRKHETVEPVSTVDALLQWFETAWAGARCCYYTGEPLWLRRPPTRQRDLPLLTAEQQALADAVQQIADAGYLWLFQDTLDCDGAEDWKPRRRYIAVRSTKALPKYLRATPGLIRDALIEPNRTASCLRQAQFSVSIPSWKNPFSSDRDADAYA